MGLILSCLLSLNAASFAASAPGSEAGDDGHYLAFFSAYTRDTLILRFTEKVWTAIEAYNRNTKDNYEAILSAAY